MFHSTVALLQMPVLAGIWNWLFGEVGVVGYHEPQPVIIGENIQ
jgi:hypothetical protein